MKLRLHYIFTTLLLMYVAFPLSAQQQSGDTISYNGARYKLVSNNLITNPGFESGLTAWTDATTAAAPISTDNFTVLTTGGVNNSSYLVGTKNEGAAAAGSIGTAWPVQSGKSYYFSYYVKYQTASTPAATELYMKMSLTNSPTSSAEPKVVMGGAAVNSGGAWTRNDVVFLNSGPAYSHLVARLRWLGGRLGIDQFELYEVDEVVNVVDLQNLINQAEAMYNAETAGAAAFLTAIETAQSFLTGATATEVIQAIADLNEAIKAYKIANATPENPLDMTHFIVNQGFDENQSTGWKGAGVVNYHEVEFYEKTFNMYQEISGLPAGKYVLKTQGFERPKGNDGGAAYRAGTETIYARFYANATSFPEKTVPFNSLYKHGYTGTGSSNGYVNTMASAEIMFNNQSNNYYETTLSGILLNEGDVLTIGARTEFIQSGYWALFDNFRLEYHGSFEVNDLLVGLSENITVAQGMLSLKMQNTALAQLNTALTAAQQVVAASSPTLEEVETANASLVVAINTANTSNVAYITLQATIDDAIEFLKTATGAKALTVQGLLNIAQSVVIDLDATLAAINKANADLFKEINKQIYVPTWMMGDVNSPTNAWTMKRSKQSKNWIVFWEAGYGEEPGVLTHGNYRFNVDELLKVAEQSFDFYADSLKFIKRGQSKTDQYKMIIRVRYTSDWEASGSGVDNTIGLLTLTAWSAQVAGHTLAHEVGHCFQYQVHCDNNDQNGWMYGFGANASGGNGWWEQCAQWQAFKIYPAQQFTDGRFAGYLNTAHKHILHEAPRYDNYFIHDYFTYRHGMDMIGRLWNESKRPEDPVETYKRITGITQPQFNDEMFDRAARFTTWDIPALKSYGASKINSRAQTKMIANGENFWLIDPTVCPENYGYNVIKLNAPQTAKRVTVTFEGKAGMDGYRKLSVTLAGWRYGFVALLNDGTRVYGDIGRASYLEPDGILNFECPANTKQLWLVVVGAPYAHWRHAWDDDDTNDEQWPYRVRFNNTNLLGYTNVISSVSAATEDHIRMYSTDNTLFVEELPVDAQVRIYTVSGACLLTESPNDVNFSTTLPSGMYIINIQSEQGIVNRKIIVQ